MNSALLVIDADGEIAACNPPAELILGERAEALRGRSAAALVRERRAGRGLHRAQPERGRPVPRRREHDHAFGRTRVPIGISCAPIVDADGARVGVVAIFQDLTEIKQLQRQVLQTEKMASIGQLAAGVAHEINNPMGFIHANLFQMAEYVADLRRAFSAGATSCARPSPRGDAERGARGRRAPGCDGRGDPDRLPARGPRQGDPRVPGRLGADPAHRAGPARLLAPGHRRARARRPQPVSRFHGQHRVADDETPGGAGEGLRTSCRPSPAIRCSSSRCS